MNQQNGIFMYRRKQKGLHHELSIKTFLVSKSVTCHVKKNKIWILSGWYYVFDSIHFNKIIMKKNNESFFIKTFVSNTESFKPRT